MIDITRRNYGVLQAQIKGLTHADSLLQPPFRGNCLNWVLGHITQSRDRMLRVMGQPGVWTAEQIVRYERDAPPVLEDGPDVVPFEQILADLTTMHDCLMETLEGMSQDDLDAEGIEVIKGAPPWSVAAWLDFLLWHETYHVGQTEYLRQLAGVNDKVI
jgi:hypothetical protein